MLEHLKGQYVTLAVWDRESPDYDEIGGGIKTCNPRYVITLLDVDEHWVEFQWKHSGQIVAVPVCDVVCIAADLPKVEAPKEEPELTADDVRDISKLYNKGTLTPMELVEEFGVSPLVIEGILTGRPVRRGLDLGSGGRSAH